MGGRPPPAGQGLPDEYLSYLKEISVAPPIMLSTVHKGYPPSAFEPSFPKQQRSCDSAQGSCRKRLGGVIAVLEVILYLGSTNTPRRLRRRHGGCIPPLAWYILPKCCFGCVLRSVRCRGASVALSMDMAIAIWAFQPWEHTLIGAKVSHFLHQPLHHR